MSSLFELKDRVRRLREALGHVRRSTLADAGEIQAEREGDAADEWRSFLAELREYSKLAEGLTAGVEDAPGIDAVYATQAWWGSAAGATLH